MRAIPLFECFLRTLSQMDMRNKPHNYVNHPIWLLRLVHHKADIHTDCLAYLCADDVAAAAAVTSTSSASQVLTCLVWWEQNVFVHENFFFNHVCHRSKDRKGVRPSAREQLEKYAEGWRPQINYELCLLLFFIFFIFNLPSLCLPGLTPSLCLCAPCIFCFPPPPPSQVSLPLLPLLREVWRQEASRSTPADTHPPFTFAPMY